MKITTNLKALGVATTMLTGFVLGGSVTSYAAEDEDKHGGEYKSKAIIQFKASDDFTPPVDPEEPGKPVDPKDPTDPDGKIPEGTKGPLSIDYASSLTFGEQKITSTDQTYFAEAQKFKGGRGDGPNYVQVTDSRGTEEGWSLQVIQDGQFETEKGKVLDGAEITFKNAWVNTASSSKKPSIVKESYTLTPGKAENMMSAKAGEGNGTFVLVFGNKDVAAKSIELKVPGKTTKYAGQYSTSFTWTLTDVPGQDGK
ncbi:WxL domain-containing protein [Lysinibacillus sp. CTST325]